MPAFRRLTRRELPKDTVALARFLIGCTLVRDREGGHRAGRIVETEAYLPDDAASHAFRGPTPRNRSMYLRRGHAYVYISYGVWPMLNITSDEPGIGAAVLVRALEPLDGLLGAPGDPPIRLRDIARGPGRLARAMDITMALDGVDLCEPGPLMLAAPTRARGAIGVTKRIGITKDADLPLRFIEAENRFLSGPRSLNAG
jgi:DNA-3-methyladenine glycosylase